MAERPVRLSLEYILPMPRLKPGDRRSTFERALGLEPYRPISPAAKDLRRGFTPETKSYKPKNPGDPRLTLVRALGSLPKLSKTRAEINAARGLTPETRKYR